MPVIFPNLPTDEELLTFAKEWLNLIAAAKYREAFELSIHDPYYGWSPDLLQKTIQGYGLPEPNPTGRLCRPTPPESAPGTPPDQEVQIFPNSFPAEFIEGDIIGEIQHSIPLDGHWSDLTVTFAVVRLAHGISPCLNEIHVF